MQWNLWFNPVWAQHTLQSQLFNPPAAYKGRLVFPFPQWMCLKRESKHFAAATAVPSAKTQVAAAPTQPAEELNGIRCSSELALPRESWIWQNLVKRRVVHENFKHQAGQCLCSPWCMTGSCHFWQFLLSRVLLQQELLHSDKIIIPQNIYFFPHLFGRMCSRRRQKLTMKPGWSTQEQPSLQCQPTELSSKASTKDSQILYIQKINHS